MFAPRLVFAMGALLLTAALALFNPLLVYTTSLALFGLPHVLTELRYVDERFGLRIPSQVTRAICCLLAGVVGLRLFGLLDMNLGSWSPIRLELILVLGLVIVVIPSFHTSTQGSRVLVGLASLALLMGLVISPLTTLIVLAFAHNLTPFGFLMEAYPKSRGLKLLCVFAFIIMPLMIISMGFMLNAQGFVEKLAVWTPFFRADAADHFSAFIPPFLSDSGLALPIFSAAAYLQCLHYAVVIHVLPRIQETQPSRALLLWPQLKAFRAILVTLGGLFFLGFLYSFAQTRLIYGVFAAIHAWIEIPVLLLVLTPIFGTKTNNMRSLRS